MVVNDFDNEEEGADEDIISSGSDLDVDGLSSTAGSDFECKRAELYFNNQGRI